MILHDVDPRQDRLDYERDQAIDGGSLDPIDGESLACQCIRTFGRLQRCEPCATEREKAMNGDPYRPCPGLPCTDGSCFMFAAGTRWRPCRKCEGARDYIVEKRREAEDAAQAAGRTPRENRVFQCGVCGADTFFDLCPHCAKGAY